jgi:Protein of unknown function (DUF2510)
VAGLLAGALVTLMVLLRRLDLLRWHERVTIWEPTTRLFHNMGQLPYVPRPVIDAGRYRPSGWVRVVDYPDPYPLRSTKVVTVEHLGAADGSAEPEVVVGETRAVPAASPGTGPATGQFGLPAGDVPAATASAVAPARLVAVEADARPPTSSPPRAERQARGPITAGWYADPSGSATYRYWDGDGWTRDVR